jgi:acyl-CoA synthetase (AMP-forming)/AMP-acid ligase II
LRHIERCCGILRPDALIASARAHLLRAVSPTIRAIGRKFITGAAAPGATRLDILDCPPKTGSTPRSPGDPALVTFTSGSTGEPKAVMRTHGFLLAQYQVLERTLGLAPGAVDLITLPIFALTNLACGVTSIVPDADLRRPGQVDPAPVVGQIVRMAIQSTAASPAFLQGVVGYCEAHGLRLPSLRKVFAGGGPVTPSLLQRLGSVAPNAAVVAIYGSTEAEPIATLRLEDIGPADLEAMASGGGLLTGTPVPEISLRILPDRWGSPVSSYSRAVFEADCLHAGRIGEIVVSGSNVLPSYLNGRGDDETKLRVGGAVWHRTGDCGYLDTRGRLWLAGRASARISDERGVLYPYSVEYAAAAFPGVARAAFVAHRGRRTLVVEWSSGSRPRDASALKERFGWAAIDQIISMRKIPLDNRHNAKIDYPSLLAAISAEYRA